MVVILYIIIRHNTVGVGPVAQQRNHIVDGHLLAVPVSSLDSIFLNDHSILAYGSIL